MNAELFSIAVQQHHVLSLNGFSCLCVSIAANALPTLAFCLRPSLLHLRKSALLLTISHPIKE